MNNSPLSLSIVGLALTTPAELDLVAHIVRPSLDDFDEPLQLRQARRMCVEVSEGAREEIKRINLLHHISDDTIDWQHGAVRCKLQEYPISLFASHEHTK